MSFHAADKKLWPALGAEQFDQVIITVLTRCTRFVDLIKRTRLDVLIHRHLNAARFTNTHNAADMLLDGRC